MNNSTIQQFKKLSFPTAFITFILICFFHSNSYGQVSRIGSVSFGTTSKSTCRPESGNTTVTYTTPSTRSANGTVNGTSTLTGLPTGVTASSLAGFTATGGTAFPNRTLTLAISP